MCAFYSLYHIEFNFEVIALLMLLRHLEGLGR